MNNAINIEDILGDTSTEVLFTLIDLDPTFKYTMLYSELTEVIYGKEYVITTYMQEDILERVEMSVENDEELDLSDIPVEEQTIVIESEEEAEIYADVEEGEKELNSIYFMQDALSGNPIMFVTHIFTDVTGTEEEIIKEFEEAYGYVVAQTYLEYRNIHTREDFLSFMNTITNDRIKGAYLSKDLNEVDLAEIRNAINPE